jgi:hypothetical protein
MVKTRKLILQAEISIDVPMDIIEDEDRLDEITDGLRKAMTKGFYEQGVEFEVIKTSFKVK